jgi:hypothetical protein
MVGSALVRPTQATGGGLEAKRADLLPLHVPVPPRAERRRTLDKTVLPVELRDRSDKSSEHLLSSSWAFPPARALADVAAAYSPGSAPGDHGRHPQVAATRSASQLAGCR